MSDAPTFLVTGGAGYIGAHVVRALQPSGRVVVLDDLTTGSAATVPSDVTFVEGSILDGQLTRRLLTEHNVTAVVHLAGRKAPGESVLEPEKYFDTNVLGTQTLLRSMLSENVRQFVFSSSCSVYGTPRLDVVDELTPLGPESPYGHSKLYGESMVKAMAEAFELRNAEPFRWMVLRYFNVIGSSEPGLQDRGAQNLVPLALRALRSGVPLNVHGSDWPTPDGTCIRDYVDVEDLARAHALAISALHHGAPNATINISTGQGSSVLDVITAMSAAAKRQVPHVFGPRRAGDPARIIGSSATAEAVLGWAPKFTLNDSIGRAFSADSVNPR